MPNDPVAVLQRVRQAALDEAERAFAAAVQAEATARDAATAADARILSEADAAADLAKTDAAVEAFAAWLPTGRKQCHAAWQAHEHALARLSVARAELTLAQAAAEATAKFLERQADLARRTQGKAVQAALDDVGLRKK